MLPTELHQGLDQILIALDRHEAADCPHDKRIGWNPQLRSHRRSIHGGSDTRQVDAVMMDSEKASLIRYAEPGEIADAVAFLTSDEAKFINGQVLCVDGGLTLFPS